MFIKNQQESGPQTKHFVEWQHGRKPAQKDAFDDSEKLKLAALLDDTHTHTHTH